MRWVLMTGNCYLSRLIEVIVVLFVVAKRGEDSDVRRAAALFPPPDTRHLPHH